MSIDSKKSDESKRLVCFQASIPLDGPNSGKSIETMDEVLAAKQGISVEPLKETRVGVLAGAYPHILIRDGLSEKDSLE